MASKCKCAACNAEKCPSKSSVHRCVSKQDNSSDFLLGPIVPYPDEVLTTIADRLLYLIGGMGQKEASCPVKNSPSTQSLRLCASNSVLKISSCKENPNRRPSPCAQKLGLPKKSESRQLNKSIGVKVSKSNSQKANCPASKCPNNQRTETNRGILSRSYSICTFAYRKMKNILTGDNCPEHNARWLWTKQRKHGENCQIYEVFKNSTISSHPKQFDNPSASRIIFIMLPTGIIMPFETVNESANCSK